MEKNTTIKYEYCILRPGGNNQMLIKNLIPKKQKRLINDEMIKCFPNVEQVSFYSYDQVKKKARLELAGGEFCGNATRSLAFLVLKGGKGEIKVKVSGAKQILRAGIKDANTAYAQMPINKNLSVQKINKTLFRIDLEGITHLICLDKTSSSVTKLKTQAWDILKRENLLYSLPAAGVMFIKQYKNFIKLKPVVWVRDIETLLFETACASGTAAVGLWKTLQNSNPQNIVQVLQPSGKIIQAQVSKNPFAVFIDGPVEILKKGGKKI